MRFMRTIGFADRRSAFMAAAVTVIASASVALAAYSHVDTSTENVPVDGAVEVVIMGVNGNITVTGEEGRDEIFLKTIKKITASDEEEAREISSSMSVEVTRSGDIIKLESVYPKDYRVKRNIFSMIINKNPRMIMEMVIAVPQELGVTVTTATGEVSVYGSNAPVKISSSSGKVEARDIAGELDVALTSGRINASDINGPANLHVTSGKIFARNIEGDVSAGATAGKMELTELKGKLICAIEYGEVIVEGVGGVEFRGIGCDADFVDVSGAIDATSASGNMNFRVVPVKAADYRMISSSGNITLRFLEIMEEGYTLIAGTTSGDISANLPINISNVGRNRIAGRVRAGKAKIFIETASGDISITEPGE